MCLRLILDAFSFSENVLSVKIVVKTLFVNTATSTKGRWNIINGWVSEVYYFKTFSTTGSELGSLI